MSIKFFANTLIIITYDNKKYKKIQIHSYLSYLLQNAVCARLRYHFTSNRVSFHFLISATHAVT